MARAREADALDEVAARVGLFHGPRLERELRWWVALDEARRAAGEGEARRVAWALELHGLAAQAGFAPWVGDVLERYRTGDRAEEALDQAADRVAVRLGLVETLRFGPVPGLGCDHPAAYRTAWRLGELRAAQLLATPGHEARLATELPPARELLGLREGWFGLGSAADVALWDAADAVLEVAVGGLAHHVFRAAHDLVVLGSVGFRGLAFRRALGGLQLLCRRLRADALADELDALARELVRDPTGPTDPPRGLARRVAAWLEAALPTRELEAVQHARIVVWADRFRDHHARVDEARIEGFLAQFPGELRWVGEGVLDAVRYRTRAQLVASLGFVLDGYGLARQKGACLVSVGPDDFWDDLRGAGLRLPRRTLAEAARDPAFPVLIAPDDAVITGSRQQEAWEAALAELDPLERAALADRELVLAFAIGAPVGVDHLGTWLESQGLRPRILVGHEQRLLSAFGWEELDADTLYDEATGAVTQPLAVLAEPLFSVHDPTWAGRDPVVARDVCADIGRSLIGGLPDAADWSAARVAGAALGVGGLQGRDVFGHRTPESTLTLLWCPGTWRDRPWLPLFPDPEDPVGG